MSGVLTRSRAKSQPNLPQEIPNLAIFQSVESNNFHSLTQENSDLNNSAKEVTIGMDNKKKIGMNMEDAMDQWLTMFNRLNETLTSLQAEVRGMKTIQNDFAIYSTEWKESVDKVTSDLELKQDQQEFKIKLLTNMVINQEEKIKFWKTR